MSDIRRQLGLDYLKKKAEQRPASDAGGGQSDEFYEEAVLAFTPRVLQALAQSPDRTETVFKLVDQLGQPVKLLGPVLEALRNKGYVDLVDEDPKGDSRFRLTDRGAKIVAKL